MTKTAWVSFLPHFMDQGMSEIKEGSNPCLVSSLGFRNST